LSSRPALCARWIADALTAMASATISRPRIFLIGQTRVLSNRNRKAKGKGTATTMSGDCPVAVDVLLSRGQTKGRSPGGTWFSKGRYQCQQRVTDGSTLCGTIALSSLGQTVKSPAGSISRPGMMRPPRSKPDRWHPERAWSYGARIERLPSGAGKGRPASR
jgi:hypothetical protein